jgi:8-oxo-dGTP pyrophosphatase MutT (NUDIX family)
MVKSCRYVTNVIYDTKLEVTENFIKEQKIDFVSCVEYSEKYHSNPKKLGILIIYPLPQTVIKMSTTDIITKIKSTNIKREVRNYEVMYKRYITVLNRNKQINNKQISYDIVGRGNGTSPNCVCIFPYDKINKLVYVIKEYHQGTDENKYGLPGGYYEEDKHKDILEAARYELSEECGIKGDLINLKREGYSELKWVTNKVVPFICIDPIVDETPKKGDIEENIIIEKISIDEMMKKVYNCEFSITSVMTILLSLKYMEI